MSALVLRVIVPEEGEGQLAQADEAKDVHLELAAKLLERYELQRSGDGYPRVVYQCVEAVISDRRREPLGRPTSALLIRDIQDDRYNTAGKRFAVLMPAEVQRVLLPTNPRKDGIPVIGEAPHRGETDTLRCACYENVLRHACVREGESGARKEKRAARGEGAAPY